eukprot:scaffold3775_cov182-Pinguiococcus_pyrenoidosus.AAC.1
MNRERQAFVLLDGQTAAARVATEPAAAAAEEVMSEAYLLKRFMNVDTQAKRGDVLLREATANKERPGRARKKRITESEHVTTTKDKRAKKIRSTSIRELSRSLDRSHWGSIRDGSSNSLGSKYTSLCRSTISVEEQSTTWFTSYSYITAYKVIWDTLEAIDRDCESQRASTSHSYKQSYFRWCHTASCSGAMQRPFSLDVKLQRPRPVSLPKLPLGRDEFFPAPADQAPKREGPLYRANTTVQSHRCLLLAKGRKTCKARRVHPQENLQKSQESLENVTPCQYPSLRMMRACPQARMKGEKEALVAASTKTKISIQVSGEHRWPGLEKSRKGRMLVVQTRSL